jgi:hypothetical protein
MRRALSLLLAALMLAVPSAAFAQSAGDEQYADPFDRPQQPSGSQEAPAQTQAPAPAPAPAQGGDTGAAAETQVAQQTAAPTLPATGLPVGLLAGTGALLLAAGTTLRRRTS